MIEKNSLPSAVEVSMPWCEHYQIDVAGLQQLGQLDQVLQ